MTSTGTGRIAVLVLEEGHEGTKLEVDEEEVDNEVRDEHTEEYVVDTDMPDVAEEQEQVVDMEVVDVFTFSSLGVLLSSLFAFEKKKTDGLRTVGGGAKLSTGVGVPFAAAFFATISFCVSFTGFFWRRCRGKSFRYSSAN